MSDTIPRVSLFDGSFRKLGELVSAGGIERSFALDNAGVASFQVDTDDPLSAEASPLRGRVVVIQSDIYPEPWLGFVTRARQGKERGLVSLTAQSYARLMTKRYLRPDTTLNGTCGELIGAVLDDVNLRNRTGIERGVIGDNRTVFDGSLSRAHLKEAVDQLADFGALEWWLDADVQGSDLRIFLHVSEFRGSDRFHAAHLVDPGSATWDDWVINGEALVFELSVAGGQSNVVQSASDVVQTSARAKDVQALAPHGYPVEGLALPPGPMGQSEALEYVESVASEGLTRTAASNLLSRGSLAGVARSLRLSVPDTVSWNDLCVGNVVHVRAPGAFLGDYDGPVRIQAVQPREEMGVVELVVRLLGNKT